MSSDDQDSRENRDSESPTPGETKDPGGSAAGGDSPADTGSTESETDTGPAEPIPAEPETRQPEGSPDSRTEAGSVDDADEPPTPAAAGGGDSGEPPDDEGGAGQDAPRDTSPDTPEDDTAEQPAESKPAEKADEAAPDATYYDDPYDDYEYDHAGPETETKALTTTAAGGSTPPTPPPSEPEEESGDDEEGMARMSFLEHLEELRTRILQSLYGLVVAYGVALIFKTQLFDWMRQPFDRAAENLPPELNVQLVAITPIEQFHLLWLKLPIVAAIFLAAPWLGYQAWAFIAPGLYQRERRWAVPFIMATTVLFLLGGVFGYFVALRFALEFLLGVGQEVDIQSMISVNNYYGFFVSIMLGLGVVFQLPTVIFGLTVLRIASPGFLLTNVRYAILVIFALAAVITPTPDIFNMILFAAPMILLFFLGIGASHLFVLHREDRGVPWRKILLVALLILVVIAVAVIYYLQSRLGYQFSPDFPWFIRP